MITCRVEDNRGYFRKREKLPWLSWTGQQYGSAYLPWLVIVKHFKGEHR